MFGSMSMKKQQFARLRSQKSLQLKYGLKTTPKTKANFDRRIRLIIADNERGKTIVIQLAGKTLSLPETEPNGHAIGEFKLDAATVTQHASGGRLTYHAILKKGDDRRFTGSINLIPPTGVSVISDFDDTVKITHATDRTKMLDHSLYQDYKAVPAMSQLYTSWAQNGATIHFASSSPWQLYEPIDKFLTANGFPARSLSLKYFRFKDTTLLNLFRKGTETKPAQIQPILQAFPNRRFVLVGDSGQEDPEVYAAMMKKFPSQVVRIYIRNVTKSSPTDKRFQDAFKGIDPEKWMLFDEPSKLVLPE